MGQAGLPGFDTPQPDRPARRSAKVISYGGGVDSFCMLLDAMDRGERPDALVFADVGDPRRLDPGEWPETYRHLRDVVIPYANKRGIPFYWLSTEPGLRVKGAIVQVYPIRPGARFTRSGSGYMRWGASTGGVQIPTTGSRSCTAAFKVERYQKWLADNMPDTDVSTWIGYDAAEDHRIQTKIDRGEDPYSAKVTPAMRESRVGNRARYPLRETNLDREACKALIRKHGLEVPRKSACMYCPFIKDTELLELLRREPEVFEWIEAWERDRRQKPTTFNVILGLYGFSSFTLSGSRYRMMRKVQELRRSRQQAKRRCEDDDIESLLFFDPVSQADQLARAKGLAGSVGAFPHAGRVYRTPKAAGAVLTRLEHKVYRSGVLVAEKLPALEPGQIYWQPSKRKKPPSNAPAGAQGELYKPKVLKPEPMRRSIPGARATWAWLIDHDWIDGSGCKLTPYGAAIVKAWQDGPNKADAETYWTGKLREVKGGFKAVGRTDTPPATDKSPGWPIRQAAGRDMQLGVHYTSPTMREHLQGKYPEAFSCVRTDEETAMQGNLSSVVVSPAALTRRLPGRKRAG